MSKYNTNDSIKILQETLQHFDGTVSPSLMQALTENSDWLSILISFLGIGAGAVLFVAFMIPAISRSIIPKLKETRLADYLPFQKIHEDEKTLICNKNTYVRCIEVQGNDTTFISTTEQESNNTVRKNWIDSLAEINVTVRVFVLRERVNCNSFNAPKQKVLHTIYKSWNKSFRDSYLTRQVIILSTETSSKKIAEDRMNDATDITITVLSAYHPKVITQKSGKFQRAYTLLEFWANLASPLSKPNPIAVKSNNISDLLTADTVFFGGEEGEIVFQSGQKKLLMASIGIRKFGDFIDENMVAELQNINGEYTLLHLIEPMSKTKATLTLLQQNRMESATRFSKTLSHQFQTALEAVDGVDEKSQSLSRYSLTIFIKGKDANELSVLEGEIRRVCSQYGATAVREGIATQISWFNQFPSYEKWPRPHKLLSRNIASLVTLNRMPSGLEKSDWGNGPISLFRTSGGTTYNFQFHVSSEKDAVAHGVTIGPTGSGKTTILCFLTAMAMRHENLRCYIFDRYQGAYVFTKAAEGSYITFNNSSDDPLEENTTLNPFQCQDSNENRQFLKQWLKNISGCEDSVSQDEIGLAIDENFGSLAREQRSLSSLYDACFAPNGKLKAELNKWVDPTLYGNIFNAKQDTLDLSTSRLVSFDFTKIFEDENLTRAALSYLMHRIQSTISEYQSPALIFIDETEPMLRHPLFRQYFLIMLQEYRKRGAGVISAFQRPEAIAATGMSETIRGQAQTMFFFANPQAKERDYADWHLTDHEWSFITGKLTISRRLKRGILLKRASGESVVLDVDLSPLGKHLKIFSSGRSSVKMAMDYEKQFKNQWVTHYINQT